MRRTKRGNKTPWLTIGPDPFMATCQRCGGREPKPEFPLTTPAFVAYSDYLCEKHATCAPTPESEERGSTTEEKEDE